MIIAKFLLIVLLAVKCNNVKSILYQFESLIFSCICMYGYIRIFICIIWLDLYKLFKNNIILYLHQQKMTFEIGH